MLGPAAVFHDKVTPSKFVTTLESEGFQDISTLCHITMDFLKFKIKP